MNAGLTPLERDFLEAAAELTLRQGEIEPLISSALGRRAFDYWIRGEGRGDPALDALHLTADGAWRFHFHGLEISVVHVSDGRAVRIDFGPDGRLAFTPGGVGGFVERTRAPWRTFPALKTFLDGSVGYDHARCVSLCEVLRAKGLVAEVSPDVAALVKRCTTFVPGRGHVLDIPAAERPRDEDLLLCDKLVLTDAARELLRLGTAPVAERAGGG